MTLIIILITLFFLCTAFIPTATHIIQHSLLAYLVYEIQFSINHPRLLLIGFVIITLLFFRLNYDRNVSRFKTFFFSAFQTMLFATLGFLTAYILLFIIAFLQLNNFAMLININPKIIGLESSKEVIVRQLQDQTFQPEVVLSDNDQGSILAAIAAVTTGTSNYYGNAILPAIPHFVVIPIKKPDASFLLIDNVVIVTQAKENDLKAIIPDLGYHLVKNYFPTKKIKADAKIVVLGEEKYADYRISDAQKKLEKIDSELEKISGKVSSLSATITTNTANIEDAKVTIEQDKKQEYKDYSSCLIAKNPTVLCKDLQTRWSAKMQTEQDKIDKWTKEIKADQDLIDAYKYYDNFFRSQQQNLSIMATRVPNEDGVFLPKDSIRIVITGSDKESLLSFFETLVHEYLHYSSYASDTKKFDSTFFEEGLTEFFARKIIKDSMHVETNFGYPVQVKIITAMTNLITESEFADIYFAKDEDALEQALDRVYGDGFYKNNYISFESLQYLSDPKQILKTANGIMQKIGGEKLTEKDLYSSD